MSVTKEYTNRPHMDWIDDTTLQLILDILWNAEGVSMDDWRECARAIEGYYGGLADFSMQCSGKSLVITDLESRIEDLEKQNIVLQTKYSEARDEVVNNGGDVKQFEEVGKLVKDYLDSKAVYIDGDGKEKTTDG